MATENEVMEGIVRKIFERMAEASTLKLSADDKENAFYWFCEGWAACCEEEARKIFLRERGYK